MTTASILRPSSRRRSTLPDAAQTVPQPKHGLRYLTPGEYPLWDALVGVSLQGNVLCRSWWLNALRADVRVLGYFAENRLVAGIPLYFERRLGLTVCRMPKLVHTWGVIMEPIEGKNVTVASREIEILTAFAKELANQRFFIQSFHPTLLNWLPFYWNGFRQMTYFGYVFENLTNLDKIWEQMDGSVRQNIRKAEKKGITVVPCSSTLVSATAEKTFKHQHKSLPYSREYLNQIYSAAKENGAGECFAAIDKEGRTHAATFLVWDRKRAYNLASGSDPELRSSGAESFLLWHLFGVTADRAEAFDFAGSVVQRIERFERGFGATLVPYNRILRLPGPLQAYCALMGIL
jgi:hypothetical protein